MLQTIGDMDSLYAWNLKANQKNACACISWLLFSISGCEVMLMCCFRVCVKFALVHQCAVVTKAGMESSVISRTASQDVSKKLFYKGI